MSDFWFKPKTYGYGATPANWKGWAASLTYAVLLAAVTLLLLPWQAKSGTSPTAWEIGVWLVAVTILSAVFIGLSYAKTDGHWHWRWGN
jgi:hypothetical protein